MKKFIFIVLVALTISASLNFGIFKTEPLTWFLAILSGIPLTFILFKKMYERR